MPAEVFEIWLGPHLAYYGLDPEKTKHCFADDTLRSQFADRTFHEWAQYGWRRCSYPQDLSLLHPLSIERASSIAEHATARIFTATADIKDTNKRFWIAAAHVRYSSADYTPLITIFHEGKLYVIDGHHRLAAILSQPLLKNVALEMWLGSRSY